MGEWHYSAWRLNGDGTETLLDPDLPIASPAITNVLSGPHGFSGSISPAFPRLLDSAGQPILKRWSTAIYAEESGTIRSGCILSKVGRNPNDASLALTGVGFTAAIKGQPYEGSVFYVEKEALDIGRAIWDHWQAQPGGNLGLILDRTTKTGKKIGQELAQVEFDTQAGPVSFESGPYKLNEWETSDLGGKFDDLAKDTGFDYYESHRLKADGSGVEHHLDFFVPRRGTRRSDIRFVAGENMLNLPEDEFAEDTYARGVLVLGAGEGRTMKRKFSWRPGETRLRRIAITQDTSLKTDAQVFSRGQALLPQFAGAPQITQVTVIDHPNAPMGSWVEGDEILVENAGDWGTAEYWVRVISTTYNPDDLSVASLAVIPADTISL